MLPFSNLITIDKSQAIPVYLQICNSIIVQIKKGIIKKGTKLPGSRSLAELLQVHRKTVIAAYEELEAQGWITIHPSLGTYISDSLPEITPRNFKKPTISSAALQQTGYALHSNDISTNVFINTGMLELNDGLPDERLAPMDSLSRAIRNVLKGQRGKLPLSYSHIEGNINLRQELSLHLKETRALDFTPQNIFITRGSLMAIYLSLNVLLKKGDHVIAGTLGYKGVNLVTQHLGGNLIKVPIDDYGLCIDAIETICRKKKIRAIYITPHHHYPTTVTMPPERRIALLALAEKYGIAIIEDDYDYDYHYRHSPFLPLASSDPAGVVIYIGSFSKTLSPAFRIGYIAAPTNLIYEITKLRRIIDRQGDSILEQALAELLKWGEIKSHLRRTCQAYQQRRDIFCTLLKDRLEEQIQFKTPDGGLAVWAQFDKKLNLPNIAKKAATLGLYISDGNDFSINGKRLNATRLGFAALNVVELEKAIILLEKSIKS